MKNIPALVDKAAKLGAAAFARGALRVPALDVDFQPLFKGLKVGEALAILTAWLRAWDTANIEAPVEDLDN